MALAFDFRPQLYGPWDTAKGFLVEQLDRLYAGLNSFQAAVNTSVATAIPTGTILPSLASSVPDGFLLCDGSIYSRTVKARLFQAIGIVAGAGDGTTTFAVPDLRGRFPLGVSTGGTGAVLGGTGGSIDHTHSVGGQTVPSLSVPSEAVTGSTGTGTTGTGTTGTGTTGTGSLGPTNFALVGGFGAGPATNGVNAFATTVSFTVPGLSVPGLSVPGLDVPSLSVSGNTAGTNTGTGVTGAGTSGTANPPFLAVNYIIKD